MKPTPDFIAEIKLSPGKTFSLNGELYIILDIDHENRKLTIQEYYAWQYASIPSEEK